MHIQRLCAVFLLSGLPPAAADEEIIRLDPVVVTATRTPETADETLASVTVVDRQEIERLQARTVADALRGIPGLGISNSGGPGQPTSFFLRGSDSDHVLVLIDGVKVGSPTLGVAPFQDFPIDQVERIEVVRGPRSSLYGSEAIGGVIQIFTRKGGGPLTPRASLGGGSYGTTNASMGLSGGGEQGWFDLSGRFEDSSGFNACTGKPFVGGCFVDQPDRDGLSNRAGHVRAGYRFQDLAELDLHWLRSGTHTDYDGGPFGGNRSQTNQQIAGGKLVGHPLPDWTLTLSGGRSWDDLQVFFEQHFVDRFDTTRDTLSWQNDIQLGDDQLLTAGLDWQNDRVDSTLDYTLDARRNRGLFTEYQGGFGNHSIKLSARHDHNEQFGGHHSGDLAWGYRLSNDWRLTASYGTAFKAPTFNDLYYPFFGNPNLEPETSQSLEIGISGGMEDGAWSLNLYQTRIEELIAFDAVALHPANIDTARIRGIEAVLSARVQGWDLNTNLTLLDPVNRSSGPNQGNQLPRRPRQSLRLDLDRSFGDLSLGGTLYAVGQSFDDLANRFVLDPYLRVDLRAEYRLGAALCLQARLENLLDADYETAAFYNQPGRALYFTLRYAP